MKVIVELGIVKETEKAYLVNYSHAMSHEGFKAGQTYANSTCWIPKSQVEVLSTKENRPHSYTTYHNLKTNAYGTISEGQAKRHQCFGSIVCMIPQWLYKKNMVYGYGL